MVYKPKVQVAENNPNSEKQKELESEKQTESKGTVETQTTENN